MTSFPLRSALLVLGFGIRAFAAVPVLDDPTMVPPSPTASSGGLLRAVPVGKTLIFPIAAAEDADGYPLEYKVTSSSPKVIARVKTGNPLLKMNVSYDGGSTGSMEFILFRDWAPKTTAFIGGFAQAGFYNNVKFHRIVKDFVLQGGDPLGTGSGGPGMTGGNPATSFSYDNEAQPGLLFTGYGQLAMANSDAPFKRNGKSANGVTDPNYNAFTGYPNGYSFGGTNGSQFFVTTTQVRFLDFKHTIFGQVVRGWSTVAALNGVTTVLNSSGEQSQPAQDVTITSASVEPDNHDAVLMLSAIGTLPAPGATITVTASDGHGHATTKSFNVVAIADTTNDPPLIGNLNPQVTPQETQLDFRLPVLDLEHDYLFYYHFLLNNGARSTSSGAVAAVLGDAGFAGGVRMGLDTRQFSVTVGSEVDPVTRSHADIGIGDRAVRTENLSIQAAPNATFSGVVARFKDLDPAGVAADYTTPATNTRINWGDGTPVDNGAVAHDAAVPGSANFTVAGTHTYAAPGIYTIVVSIAGDKGASVSARTTAVVTSGAIAAVGKQLEANTATVANRIVATFTDTAPGTARDYAATVDWGDGDSSAGNVAKLANGSFTVQGTHTYKDSEPFAIGVRIHKSGASAATDGIAWSSVTPLFKAAQQHLPPFPAAHLVGTWNSGPSKIVTNRLTGDALDPAKLKETLNGAFVVINSGNKASPISKLRFFLSNDQSVGAGDQQLIVNGLPEITVGSFPGGVGGQGNFTVQLPTGSSAAGRYLLTEFVYSDPIMDGSNVERVAVRGPIDPAVVVYNVVSESGRATSGEYLTSESGTHVTFKVLLDTQPTADVTIQVESSVTTEGTVSPASLTFTPQNWFQAQTVTVTGVNDAVAVRDGPVVYNVTLKSPTSTDARYQGLNPFVIPFANLDND